MSSGSSGLNEIRCYLFGERAVVLDCLGPVSLAKQQRLWAVADWLRSDPAVESVVCGMNNLTALLGHEFPLNEAYVATLTRYWRECPPIADIDTRLITIPVQYGGNDGPDLPEVARHTGLTEQQVVARHCARTYSVFFLGFLPGFAYLGGLDETLASPRLAEPRLRVNAGSVGIAGLQTGIYPLPAPGGWQIIGRTDWSLFDPGQLPPTRLQTGDQIRFVAVD